MVSFTILSNYQKIILFTAIGIAIGLIATAGYFWQRQKAGKLVSPLGEGKEKVEEIADRLLEDEWGLKVSYPGNLWLKAATKPGELTRYIFTQPKHGGYLTIYTLPTDAKMADEWLKKDAESASASGVLDTTIDGKVGKKMRFISPARLQAVVVDQGQLFVFEVYPEKGEETYWDNIFNQVLTKYKFLPFEEMTEDNLTVGDESEEVIYYDEEIIE